MKKVTVTFFIVVTIVLYTNSIYALINDYISLDSDGYEVSGENDNMVFIDKYEEGSNISIVIQENKYGVFEITDDNLNGLEQNIEKQFETNVTVMDKNVRTSIGKENKYYKCATVTYSLDDLKLFIKQYIIPTDNYLYTITICSSNESYFTSQDVINFLNSITIQDTITTEKADVNIIENNSTLIENSINSGIDGAISIIILAGVVAFVGLIVRVIKKLKINNKNKGT